MVAHGCGGGCGCCPGAQGMGEFVPWLRIFFFKAKGCLMTAGNFDSPFTAAALYLKV